MIPKNTTLVILGILALAILSPDAMAFSRLKSGLETITTGYLIPISRAVAGASLLLFVTLSFFKQDQYLRKVTEIFFLAVLASAGVEILKKMMEAFS